MKKILFCLVLASTSLFASVEYEIGVGTVGGLHQDSIPSSFVSFKDADLIYSERDNSSLHEGGYESPEGLPYVVVRTGLNQLKVLRNSPDRASSLYKISFVTKKDSFFAVIKFLPDFSGTTLTSDTDETAIIILKGPRSEVLNDLRLIESFLEKGLLKIDVFNDSITISSEL